MALTVDAEAGAFLGERLGETVDARLRGRIVHLAVLPGLAVDAADIHHPAKLGHPHALEGQLAQVEATAEVGVDHGVPHVPRHARHGAVAGDAGVVDQDLDRAVLVVDLLHGRLAGGEVAGVELHRGDAGHIGEALRRGLVAGIACDHLAPRRLEGDADGLADPARSTRHQRYTCHAILPGPRSSPSLHGRGVGSMRRQPERITVRRT